MKHTASLLSILLLIAISCSTGKEPEPPEADQITLVAIGDSITMGIQDAGLKKDYQLNSFPCLIAQQLGSEDNFQQPVISSPGFGIPPYEMPLQFNGGKIIADYFEGEVDKFALLLKILPLLENFSLERPYDNLGIGGARLHDVLHATSHKDSALPDNFLFDIVLRNFSGPGTTVVQQAIELDPAIVLLWIGNNDILGAVLAGGDQSLITDPDEFRFDYEKLLSELSDNTDAALFMANIPGYLSFANAFDDIFQVVVGFSSVEVPVVFDCESFEPIDFGNGEERFIPLVVEERSEQDPVKYLLPNALAAFVVNGMGIPDAVYLETVLGYTAPEAQGLVDTMHAKGLNTEGDAFGSPITGDMTITASEEEHFVSAVTEFNTILLGLSAQYDVPLVDINYLWDPDQKGAFGGYSGDFVLDDPVNTVFSLDGVHPNNLGQALVANAFIDEINKTLKLGIQKLRTEDYRGQYAPYAGQSAQKMSIQALAGVKDFFIRENN
jgi:hypothetical protein